MGVKAKEPEATIETVEVEPATPIGYVSDPSDPDDSIKEAAWNAAVVAEMEKQAAAEAETE